MRGGEEEEEGAEETVGGELRLSDGCEWPERPGSTPETLSPSVPRSGKATCGETETECGRDGLMTAVDGARLLFEFPEKWASERHLMM